jgi:hypothetical protein
MNSIGIFAHRYGSLLLLVGFSAVSMILLILKQGMFDPWLLMTGPWVTQKQLGYPNWIIGYSQFLVPDLPLHNENLSLLRDPLMLAGVEANSYFYAMRPGTGLVSFLMFSWLPTMHAARATVWTFALVLPFVLYGTFRAWSVGRWAALILSFNLASLGIFTFHANDLSAHLPGAAMGLFALLFLLHYEPYKLRADLRVYVASHAVLLVSTLFYAANIVLYVAFAMMQLRRPRKLAASAAMLFVAYLLPRMYGGLVNALYGQQIDYFSVEASYLTTAVQRWIQTFSDTGLRGGLALGGERLGEIIFSEPATALSFLLLVALLLLRARVLRRMFQQDGSRLMLLALSAVGFLAMTLLYSTAAMARGYLSYGVPISIILALALVLRWGEPGESRSRGRSVVSLAPLFALLVWQVAWANGHLLGNPTPPTQYLLGMYDSPEVYTAFINRFQQPTVFSQIGTPFSESGFVETMRRVSTQIRESYADRDVVALVEVRKAGSWYVSLVLTAFLMLPILVGGTFYLAFLTHWPLIRASGFATGLGVAMWYLAWLLVPAANSGGIPYRQMAHSCADGLKSASHEVHLSAELLEVLNKRNVAEIEFASGWGRYHPPSRVELSISFADNGRIELDAREDAYSVRARVDHVLNEVDPGSTSGALLRIVEFFDEPVHQYLGWQPVGVRVGTDSECQAEMHAFYEVRGYALGERVPAVYLY